MGSVFGMAMAGLILVVVVCICMQRSKNPQCITLRAKILGVHSHKDIKMADEAQQKQKLGLAPSSSEQQALNKVAKTHGKNQQARNLKDEVMGMFNGIPNGVMPTMSNFGNVANPMG